MHHMSYKQLYIAASVKEEKNINKIVVWYRNNIVKMSVTTRVLEDLDL